MTTKSVTTKKKFSHPENTEVYCACIYHLALFKYLLFISIIMLSCIVIHYILLWKQLVDGVLDTFIFVYFIPTQFRLFSRYSEWLMQWNYCRCQCFTTRIIFILVGSLCLYWKGTKRIPDNSKCKYF